MREMITRWQWAIFGGGVGLYLLGLGVLGAEVLNQHGQTVRNFRSYLGRPEVQGLGRFEPDQTPWTRPVREVAEALARQDVSAAETAWLDAFVAALKSPGWEGLIEVGNAYLRLGQLAGFGKAAEAKAGRIYGAALFRAQQQGSVDGVLRTAEAFAALGDREVTGRSVSIAERLAAQARDPEARDRVRGLKARLAACEHFPRESGRC